MGTLFGGADHRLRKGVKTAIAQRTVHRVCVTSLSMFALTSCEGRSVPLKAQLTSVSELVRRCSTDRDDWRPGPGSLVEPVDSGETVAPTSGVSLTADRIITFDGYIPMVKMLSRRTGVTEGVFGRQGDGPGEFKVVRTGGVFPRLATVDWIVTLGDSILAFDGRRLQLFTLNGGPVREWFRVGELEGSGAFSLALRVRELNGAVAMDLERLRREANERTYVILRFSRSGSVDTLFSTKLALLPVAQGGGWYQGPLEAAPLWDAVGNCFVFSDGTSPHLLVGELGKQGVDTLSVGVPIRPPPLVDQAELSRMTGGRKSPEPAKPRHILRLIASPDGWIWLEPVQPEGISGVEVYRVNPYLGEQRIDTVPFFPSAFGLPGEFYSVARQVGGGYGLRRVVLRKAQSGLNGKQ